MHSGPIWTTEMVGLYAFDNKNNFSMGRLCAIGSISRLLHTSVSVATPNQ